MKIIFVAIALALASCQAVADLDGDWELVNLNGETVPDDIEITLSVAEGNVNGRAACNGYMGSLVQEGTKVTMGRLGSTKMMCPPPLMEWEGRFLEAMREVSRAASGTDSLTLSDESGDTVLVFVLSASP